MRTPLHPGEKILLVTYSSWISLIPSVLIAIAALVVAYFIAGSVHWGWTVAVAAAGILNFIIRYLSWKAYIWVVTNYRVVDEIGLMKLYAKESPLDKINNVSYDQSVWGRIFNYGHVEIQTAAQVGATDYYRVQHPKRLKETITQAQSDFENIRISNQATQMAKAMGAYAANNQGGPAGIASELEQLHQLKLKGILTEEEYTRAKNKLLDK